MLISYAEDLWVILYWAYISMSFKNSTAKKVIECQKPSLRGPGPCWRRCKAVITLFTSWWLFSKSIVDAPGILANSLTWFSSTARSIKHSFCTSSTQFLMSKAFERSKSEVDWILRFSLSANFSRRCVSLAAARSLSRWLWNVVWQPIPAFSVVVCLMVPMWGLMPIFKKREVGGSEWEWFVDFEMSILHVQSIKLLEWWFGMVKKVQDARDDNDNCSTQEDWAPTSKLLQGATTGPPSWASRM